MVPEGTAGCFSSLDGLRKNLLIGVATAGRSLGIMVAGQHFMRYFPALERAARARAEPLVIWRGAADDRDREARLECRIRACCCAMRSASVWAPIVIRNIYDAMPADQT